LEITDVSALLCFQKSTLRWHCEVARDHAASPSAETEKKISAPSAKQHDRYGMHTALQRTQLAPERRVTKWQTQK